MYNQYFDIKDHCREGLLKHLETAASKISIAEDPKVLDVGCGTGVPTLFIMEKVGGKITAVDPDQRSIDYFREKVKRLNLVKRIHLSRHSLFDLEEKAQFDLVMAEGLLNIVGFEKGFLKILKLVKRSGFIVIHDEFKNRKEKIQIIEDNDCEIFDSFVLNEKIWWNDYYRCIAEQTSNISDVEFLQLFESDLLEIDAFRSHPSNFRSIYYIIGRN